MYLWNVSETRELQTVKVVKQLIAFKVLETSTFMKISQKFGKYREKLLFEVFTAVKSQVGSLLGSDAKVSDNL